MSERLKPSRQGSQTAPATGAELGAKALAAGEIAKAELTRIARLDSGQTPGAATTMDAAEIATRAKTGLSRITGLAADHVSAVRNDADGWHVTVDLIELKRIPASTDVLAAYQAVFAPTGSLLSYRRTRRYFRDQMMEEQLAAPVQKPGSSVRSACSNPKRPRSRRSPSPSTPRRRRRQRCRTRAT